jgi:hypothetical protein
MDIGQGLGKVDYIQNVNSLYQNNENIQQFDKVIRKVKP